MRGPRLGIACVMVGAVGAATAAAAQSIAPGRVIDTVACASNPGQSYALYLPSAYSADRKWPILYAFDPRARGVRPVQQYSEAAERYGYIVAGSNNSRNGPVAASDAALRAMMTDATSRFSIDGARIYFTGFSGGARVAVLAGLAGGGRAAGVIGSGAGFPEGLRPSTSIGFAYFSTAGIDDFNYPEMKELDQTLDKLRIAHRFQVFEGAHEWPPAEVCTRALAWMEIQAMRRGLRPRDDRLLDEVAAAGAEQAAREEKPGRLYWAYARYAALADDLAGLRDVTAFEQKARELAASPEVQRAVAEEAKSVGVQLSLQGRIPRLTEQAIGGDDDGSATAELCAMMASLKKQGERPANDAGRMAARRMLVLSWMQMNEAVAADVAAGNSSRAAARLRLMSLIRPEDARVDYGLARLHAGNGNRKAALQALQNAVKKGFNDVAAIDADRAFDAMRGDEAFKKILAAAHK